MDGYFPEYYSPHLTKEFAFSNPIASSPLVLFAKHGSQFAYSSIRDLIPRRLGLVKGYVNTPEIDQNPNLNKTEVLNDTINLKMLLRDRVDLIVADYHVGRYLTETELGLDPDTTLTPIYPLLANKQLYVCFPKSHPDYLDLLSDFNHGLASMRRDGTLERLKQQFKFELRNTK